MVSGHIAQGRGYNIKDTGHRLKGAGWSSGKRVHGTE